MKFRQCTMEKLVGGSIERQIAWIPEQFAKLGKYLELTKDFPNDGWKNWKIVEVSDLTWDWEKVNERSRDYLKQREASDI